MNNPIIQREMKTIILLAMIILNAHYCYYSYNNKREMNRFLGAVLTLYFIYLFIKTI